MPKREICKLDNDFIVLFFYSLTDKKQCNLQTLYTTHVKFLSYINSSFPSNSPFYSSILCGQAMSV